VVEEHAMRLWILSLLLFCPLTTLFSPFTIPIEEHATESAWLQLLRLQDCELPCWIGIELGTTTFADAQIQVETAYSDTSLYQIIERENQFRITYLPTGNEFRIALVSDDVEMTSASIIRTIYFEPIINPESGIQRPTISEMGSVLGDPEIVRLASGVEAETAALMYRGQQVHVFVEDMECDKIDLDQELLTLVLYDEPLEYAAWLSQPQEWVDYDYCYNFERTLN
jgi:hypothetical protein